MADVLVQIQRRGASNSTVERVKNKYYFIYLPSHMPSSICQKLCYPLSYLLYRIEIMPIIGVANSSVWVLLARRKHILSSNPTDQKIKNMSNKSNGFFFVSSYRMSLVDAICLGTPKSQSANHALSNQIVIGKYAPGGWWRCGAILRA